MYCNFVFFFFRGGWKGDKEGWVNMRLNIGCYGRNDDVIRKTNLWDKWATRRKEKPCNVSRILVKPNQCANK